MSQSQKTLEFLQKLKDSGQKKSKYYFIETKTYVFDLKGSSKALSF